MSGAGVPLVAVCTRDRPVALARLLAALVAQDGIAASRPILVIDNAPDGSAAAVCAAWPATDVCYVHEPAGGVVGARNRALAETPSGRALIFIDDDEVPVAGWYRAFADRHAADPEAVLVGPVLPEFAGPLPRWAVRLGVGYREDHADGAVVDLAGGGNALLPPALIEREALRFDPAFDRCGGEDTELFVHWRQRGGTLRWVAAAQVHEAVPPARTTAAYQIRRAMWGAVSYTLAVRQVPGGTRGRVLRLPMHLARAAAYAVTGVVTLRRDRLVRAGVQLARAVGTVRALVGWIPDRYRAYRDDIG